MKSSNVLLQADITVDSPIATSAACPGIDRKPAIRSFVPEITMILGYSLIAVPRIILGQELSPLLVLLALLLPLAFTLDLVRRYFDARYHFCSRYVTARQGIFSLVLRQPRVEYCLVRGIRVCQSPLGRLLDYGDVCLDTAATDCSEMRIIGIQDPHALKEMIEERRERLSKEKYGDAAAWRYLEDSQGE